MNRYIRRLVALTGIISLLLLGFPGTAQAAPPGNCAANEICIHWYLVPKTLEGYSFDSSSWWMPSSFSKTNDTWSRKRGDFPHPGDQVTLGFTHIEDTADPNFGVLYVYDDIFATVSFPSYGTWLDVEFKPGRRYIATGKLDVMCDVKNYAGEDVACQTSIDGVLQSPNIAAGQTTTYSLDPGKYTVDVLLVGSQANLWSPASQSKSATVKISAAASKITMSFKKAGHLMMQFDQAGVVADWYLNGAQVGTQVPGIDQWVQPSRPQKIEVKNMADPLAAGLYAWKDAAQTVSVRSGEDKKVIVKLKKAYLKGFLDLTCDIKSYAAEDVSCAVVIDGAPQGSIAAGQKTTYTLDPGDHVVDITLAGAQANLWSPATQSKKTKIAASATPKKLVMTFKKAGHLIVNLDQPGVVGDFYVDGVLVASQVAGIDQWLAAGTSHKVEVKNLVDPAGALWQDASQTITVKTGEDKTVTIKLQPQ